MASIAWRRSSGLGSAGRDGVGAGLDLYGAVAAGGLDELLDRPAGAGLDPPADGERGESDGRMGLDGVALAVVDGLCRRRHETGRAWRSDLDMRKLFSMFQSSW